MRKFFNSEWWRNLIANAFATVIIGILIILALRIIGEGYWDRPPVDIVSTEPLYLGDLCPGDVRYIQNLVTIEEQTVTLYQVSVMDKDRLTNFIGTQVMYVGLHHPVPGTFTHRVPWTVPSLPPDTYARSFAARGTDTSEKTEFTYNLFTITSDCFQGEAP